MTSEQSLRLECLKLAAARSSTAEMFKLTERMEDFVKSAPPFVLVGEDRPSDPAAEDGSLRQALDAAVEQATEEAVGGLVRPTFVIEGDGR